MSSPKISIIIPVYNAEEFLKETLDSLIHQTYRDIQIICVNDGSKDKSLEILQEYAKKDDRILVISQENSGPAKARNVGLDNVTGEYLMFCDADDTYQPDMCEEMLNAIHGTDYDFVMCDANMIAADENHGRNEQDIKYHRLQYKGKNKLTAWQKNRINVLLWNKIFRMSKIREYNISFPNGYEADDNAFIWQYLGCSDLMYGLDKKLYNYNLRVNSIMGRLYQKNTDKIFDRIYVQKFTIEKFVQNNLLQQTLWILRVIDNAVIWAARWINKKTLKEYLKNLNENVLTYYSLEQLQSYPMLLSCRKEDYNIVAKQLYDERKKHWFGLNKNYDKDEILIFGIPIFTMKKNLFKNKYYFLGIQVYVQNLFRHKINRILVKPLDVPENERHILCFDCLYDSNQECIDAYTFYKYLQNNNIPSKYVILKDNSLLEKIGNDENLIVVENQQDFLTKCADDIRSSKSVITSFGLLEDMNIVLKSPEYFDYIYIDHGVILLKKWVTELFNPIVFDKILVPTRLTYDLYKENNIWEEDKMLVSGMPRWDNLQKTNIINKNIFVFFTWRNTFCITPEIAGSYVKSVMEFLTKLAENITPDIEINFAWHHEMFHMNVDLPESLGDRINVISADKMSEMIKSSDMLITDFSSVCFDFMYQNKPVVFYRFDKDAMYLNNNDQMSAISAIQEDDNLYNCFYNYEDAIKKVSEYADNNFELEDCNKDINKKIFWDIECNCETLYKAIQNKN